MTPRRGALTLAARLSRERQEKSSLNKISIPLFPHAFCGEESCPLTARPSYLSVAAVATAFMAKCLIVLSSRYFCSHLVMSASRARILSSFSRTSSIRAGALCSGRLLAWKLPCLCRWKQRQILTLCQVPELLTLFSHFSGGHKTSLCLLTGAGGNPRLSPLGWRRTGWLAMCASPAHTSPDHADTSRDPAALLDVQGFCGIPQAKGKGRKKSCLEKEGSFKRCSSCWDFTTQLGGDQYGQTVITTRFICKSRKKKVACNLATRNLFKTAAGKIPWTWIYTQFFWHISYHVPSVVQHVTFRVEGQKMPRH